MYWLNEGVQPAGCVVDRSSNGRPEVVVTLKESPFWMKSCRIGSGMSETLKMYRLSGSPTGWTVPEPTTIPVPGRPGAPACAGVVTRPTRAAVASVPAYRVRNVGRIIVTCP